MSRHGVALVACLLSVSALFPQNAKPSLPDPVRFVVKYDVAWGLLRTVATEMGYTIELEDKKGGRLVTKPYQFITGSLTAEELDKVAIKSPKATGVWLRAQYVTEIQSEIISPTQTLVTVRTKIQGLHR